MKVNELLKELSQLRDDGRGEEEVKAFCLTCDAILEVDELDFEHITLIIV